MRSTSQAQIEYQTDEEGKKFDKLDVTFLNPTELELSTHAKLKKTGNQSEVTVYFDHVYNDDFTVNLFIDKSDSSNIKSDNAQTEMKKIREKLMMPIVKKEGSQILPRCKFIWGSFEYKGYAISFKESYTYFSADGYPIRGTVTLTIQSNVIPEEGKKRNKDSNSRKHWTVRSGDRLDIIASKIYNNPSYWRIIAEENDIDNPFDFPLKENIGKNIILPDLRYRKA